jgi:hypothetical protein
MCREAEYKRLGETRRDKDGERRSGYYYTERSGKGIAETGAGKYLPRKEDSRGED